MEGDSRLKGIFTFFFRLVIIMLLHVAACCCVQKLKIRAAQASVQWLENRLTGETLGIG